MTSNATAADVERWAAAIGGAALTAFGLKQLKGERSMAGAMIAAAGSGLILRGAMSHRSARDAARFTTATDRSDTRTALGGERGVHVLDAVTVNRPAAELYDVWRSFRDLPRFMDHLVDVHPLDGGALTHWVAKAPGRRTVSWDAEIINEVPGELIGWRTLPGSQVVSAGSVSFKPAPGGSGTEVRVHLQYDPPAGRAGATIAWLLGHEPSQTIREDLRRFKQLMEAGEFPTTEGQPRGR